MTSFQTVLHPRARITGAGIAVVCALASGGAQTAPSMNPPDVDLANPQGYTYPIPNSGPPTNSTYYGGAINTGTQADSWFQADTTQPAGTGVFNPFLRVQVTGSGTPRNANEQGYNTSYPQPHNIFDNKSPTNWTHDVKFADLEVVTRADGKQYYQFKLDINEPGVAPDSLLSLDGLRLFSTNTPSQNSTATFNGSGNQPGDWNFDGGTSAGQNTLLWDLDSGADRYVLLDANRSSGGSGIADMVVFFDKTGIDSARAAGNQGEYLILWSRFGLNAEAWDSGNTADGGFEEWSFMAKSGTPNNPGGGSGVPTPASMPLMLLGLAALGANRRRPRMRVRPD